MDGGWEASSYCEFCVEGLWNGMRGWRDVGTLAKGVMSHVLEGGSRRCALGISQQRPKDRS
jgi:hypothetical protein